MNTNDLRGASISSRHREWVGWRGQPEPNPYTAMTVAERIKLVWPLTVAAWAFSGNPWDESRLRRDVERVVRRER
jgi:hypothetical protein